MEIIIPRHLNLMAPVNVSATKNVDAQNTSPVMGEGLVRNPSLDVYQQSIQFSSQLGLKIDEPQFNKSAVSGNFNDVMEKARSMMMAMKNSADKYSQLPKKVEDGRGHISAAQNLIEEIHGDYQKKYGDIVIASTQYMQDVNTALGKMSANVSAGKDGKINFKPRDFLRELDSSMSKYTQYDHRISPFEAIEEASPGGYYQSWSSSDSLTKPLATFDYTDAEFQFWEKKLSGQGFIVRENNGKIEICPDLKPVREIFKSVANSSASWGGSDIMAQELQSLQTAIDAQKNAVNNSVSRLLETFRQDNSHFETLVQLLIQLIKDLN
ncbi:IpaD/SipD/SspD family type III secretion system needle tip protein, partial [Providencia alcalifaciens]|uniref:IpaD/SipD/SspD family type III secretion system needle tip protein n=1 Tax=Providencia alcalifaciens TaxID=126385 RepID=UPI002B05F047